MSLEVKIRPFPLTLHVGITTVQRYRTAYDHVDYILTVSSQRLYLLNKLKHAGLNLKALTVIFQAIVVSPILHIASFFYGY